MESLNFLAGREEELCNLIHASDAASPRRRLSSASCLELDPDLFHPEDGRLDERAAWACAACLDRLICLATALRAEMYEPRDGWYGGLSPQGRKQVAMHLSLDRKEQAASAPTERARRAAGRLADGWSIREIADELRVSTRTVQRDLRSMGI